MSEKCHLKTYDHKFGDILETNKALSINTTESNSSGCGNVDNFDQPPAGGDPPSVAVASSIVSASPTPAGGSFLLPMGEGEPRQVSGKGCDILDSTELMDVLVLEPKYVEYIRPHIMSRWLKKFGPYRVLQNLRLFLSTIDSQEKPIDNPEAWMEAALARDTAKDQVQDQNNKALAQSLKDKHRLRNFKINQRYCIDTKTGDAIYYNLPRESFQTVVTHMVAKMIQN